jgi:hypothetical protein
VRQHATQLVGERLGGGGGQAVDRDLDRRGMVDRGDGVGDRAGDLRPPGGAVEVGCD